MLDDVEETLAGTIEDEESIVGRVDLREGALIEEEAVVRGPVSIGEDTRVGSDAYVGPYTSIGPNSEIDGVHIEASVTMGDNGITADRTIIDSLVGRQATVTSNANKQPEGDRMVVG